MAKGYDQPLYILPFDHRHSYGSEVFGYHEPMSAEQTADVAASKQVIYDGFKLAIAAGVTKPYAGILVDEEFGAAILEDAMRQGFIRAVPVEKSGQHEFDFEYGDDFAAHLEKFDATFVKVLVRYNTGGDATANARQRKRLKQVSDYCATSGRAFMFELLVPAEPGQLEHVGGDRHRYDTEVRPGLVVAVVHELQDAGIEPDVWKIEGLDSRQDCQRVVEAVRRGGRSKVGCIVLGRGENEAKVIEWLRTAAGVPGFIGFAVGRSSFLSSIVALRAGKLSPEQASQEIAQKYEEWVREFEGARP
jgi:5-dehydro-2-deoxygluconokinase